jgi:hypothetical protein
MMCPESTCRCIGYLYFTGKTFDRPIHEWVRDQIQHQIIRLFYAGCWKCGRKRFRVLPQEIPPLARYALPVVETGSRRYLGSDLGLIKTLESLGKIHPHQSTLHRWTKRFGKQALDLGSSEKKSSIPMSSILAETAKRKDKNLFHFWNQIFSVPSQKYKSERRKDELEACCKILKAATFLFPQEEYPLTQWAGFLISIFHVAVLGVFYCLSDTPMQIPEEGKYLVKERHHKNQFKKGKNHGARSPPDSLLEIPAD